MSRHASLILVDLAASVDAFCDAVEDEHEAGARNAAAQLKRYADELDELVRSW